MMSLIPALLVAALCLSLLHLLPLSLSRSRLSAIVIGFVYAGGTLRKHCADIKIWQCVNANDLLAN